MRGWIRQFQHSTAWIRQFQHSSDQKKQSDLVSATKSQLRAQEDDMPGNSKGGRSQERTLPHLGEEYIFIHTEL